MTLIPRKDEYNNEQPQEHPRVAIDRSWKFHTNWGRVAEETNFFGGLFVLIFYLSIFVNLFTFMASDGFLHSVPLAITLDIIVGIVLISALVEAGGFNFILQGIMSFIGGFADVDSEKIMAGIEEDKEKYSREYEAKIEKARRESGYYESLKKPNDGEDFNTRQKNARKAAAYASADPEFIVTYKSKGNCWVKDIVRGRDKAEVYNRYKFNPMVEIMGGVTGIYE